MNAVAVARLVLVFTTAGWFSILKGWRGTCSTITAALEEDRLVLVADQRVSVPCRKVPLASRPTSLGRRGP